MGEAEDFVARKQSERIAKDARQREDAQKHFAARANVLIKRAVENLRKDEYRGHDDERVPWRGEDRLAWRLAGNRRGADWQEQVYLLADGTLLVSLDDHKTFQLFSDVYGSRYLDYPQWEWMFRTLNRLAGPEPRKRFLGIF